MTQPELVHTQKSQESQASEEPKSANSKTSAALELGRVQLAPESSQAGMGLIYGLLRGEKHRQYCCLECSRGKWQVKNITDYDIKEMTC